MKVTDWAEIENIVSKSKGNIINFNGNLKSKYYNKLLFLYELPYCNRDCCEELCEKAVDLDYKPLFMAYTDKKGNFGKDGHYPVLLMDPEDDGIFSENFFASNIMYWDTQLMKVLDEQISKNKIYRGFTSDNAAFLIRKEHYEEVIKKYTDLILKILSNHTKFTYKKIKERVTSSGIIEFFHPIDELITKLIPLLILNKRVSKKYYDQIQVQLVKISSKFNKLFTKVTTFQKLVNNDLHEITRAQRLANTTLSRYYSVYYNLISRDELYESINVINLDIFMKRVFPYLNMTKDQLLEDKNERIREYLENKIRQVINYNIPLPKNWGILNYKIEIEDIDSTLLMAVVNSDCRNNYDDDGADCCGC